MDGFTFFVAYRNLETKETKMAVTFAENFGQAEMRTAKALIMAGIVFEIIGISKIP